MPRISRSWKVVSTRLRLTIQLLQMADAACRSENTTEFESRLNEAWATFRSIPATFQIGSGNGSTTQDTTQVRPISSTTTLASDGHLGSSQLANSDSNDRPGNRSRRAGENTPTDAGEAVER